MRRDIGRLATTFDVLVVGGGIYGLMAAWEASLRGLRVALVERGDFASATSFNSARTIHGGVRSLQHLAFSEMFEYVTERRVLATIAPHLVHPLPFLMPATASLTANPLALRLYFAAYAQLTASRSKTTDPSKSLPAPRYVSRDECVALHPLVAAQGVRGGMIWHDCQLHSSERLAMAVARSADRHGAVLCNYVEALALVMRQGRVVGVRARDRVDGTDLEIAARVTIDAAGPQSSALLSTAPAPTRRLAPALSKAMNLVIPSRTRDHALAGSARGRLFFLAPWRGVTIAGTSHDGFTGAPTDRLASEGDIAALAADLNLAFPRLELQERAVLFVHRGLLPAVSSTPRHVELLRDSVVHDHASDALPGLCSILGVRYTTARATACKALDVISAGLGGACGPSRSHETPVHGGDIEHYAAFEREAVGALATLVPPVTARRLVRHYGTDVRVLQRRLMAVADTRRTLSSATDVTVAEVEHVTTHEMVVTLEDVLVRRLDAAQIGGLDATAVQAAADIVAPLLGWTPSRTEAEVSALMGRLHCRSLNTAADPATG